jgi:hypothetical protein
MVDGWLSRLFGGADKPEPMSPNGVKELLSLLPNTPDESRKRKMVLRILNECPDELGLELARVNNWDRIGYTLLETLQRIQDDRSVPLLSQAYSTVAENMKGEVAQVLMSFSLSVLERHMSQSQIAGVALRACIYGSFDPTRGAFTHRPDSRTGKDLYDLDPPMADGWEHILPLLKEVASDQDLQDLVRRRGSRIGQRAFTAIGSRSIPYLLEIINARPADIHERFFDGAVACLAEMGDASCLEPLRRLSEEFPFGREACLNSITRIERRLPLTESKPLSAREPKPVVQPAKADGPIQLYNHGVSRYQKGQFKAAMDTFGQVLRTGELKMQSAYIRALCQKELGLSMEIPDELGDEAEDAGTVYVASNLACHIIARGYKAALTKQGSASEVTALIDGSLFVISISSLFGGFDNWAWRKAGGKRISIADPNANPNPTSADRLVISLAEKAGVTPPEPMPEGGLMTTWE